MISALTGRLLPGGLAILFCFLWIIQCSKTKVARRELDDQTTRSTSLLDSLRNCQVAESKLLRIKAEEKLAVEQKLVATSSRLRLITDSIGRLSVSAQKRAFIKTSVANQVLPTIMLTDTAYVDRVVIDSTYVRAALESAQQLSVYKQENSVLSQKASSLEVESKDCYDEKIKLQNAINQFNAGCGGFFQQLFCRRCRELKRASKGN